jgi:alkaline phosphatase D
MQVSTIFAKPFEVTTLKRVGVSRAGGAITGV